VISFLNFLISTLISSLHLLFFYLFHLHQKIENLRIVFLRNVFFITHCVLFDFCSEVIFFYLTVLLRKMKTKLKVKCFVCDISTIYSARIYANASTMKYLRARRIYDLLKTGSLFLFSYLLFVFFAGCVRRFCHLQLV